MMSITVEHLLKCVPIDISIPTLILVATRHSYYLLNSCKRSRLKYYIIYNPLMNAFKVKPYILLSHGHLFSSTVQPNVSFHVVTFRKKDF